MKVIIADDEIHVCSLIKHLINWDKLGLTLLGVFHSGGDVVAQFVKEPADILICDIEMPGMSGNELIRYVAENYPSCKCIVISGFRNFEYARSAMQYGVTNYLLKPIEGDELNAALESMILTSKKVFNISGTLSEQSIRLGLIDLLESNTDPGELSDVNKKYHYQMRDGMFNTIKVVFTDIDINSDFLPRIISMFSDILKQKLMDFCYEAEIFRLSPVSAAVLMNYDADQAVFFNSILDKILRDVLVEIGGKTQCKCFLGVGIPTNSIRNIRWSWQTAKQVVCNRFESERRPIYYSEFAAGKVQNQDTIVIGYQEKQELLKYIEAIDIPSIKKWINNYFKTYDKNFSKSPVKKFDFCIHVMEFIITIFDELNVPVMDKDVFRRNAEITFDNCDSFDALKRALTSIIEAEISQRLSEKQQNMAIYAQQTKHYIDKHYAEAITLDLIAEKLNISSVYLSIVFKSETGMNYSKYLTSVRIEKAKELLKGCDMNLTQIASAIGYDSTNYFSNLFRKYTGLKPSEYRRLHQYDIGE